LDRSVLVPALKNVATQLRIDSIRSTSESGTGHPSTCMSAADLVAALFFAEMRFDPRDPQHPGSDRFVLSKGHGAPLLYAAWAEAGAFDRSELLNVRALTSDLEGHPTPRLPFVDVATGSLGQGICAAVGCALNARRIKSDYRTYCLIGDGESAEGSVWEAAEVAANDALDNLVGITDVNGLGQSRATMWGHDLEQFARRWRAFGWHAVVVDGHDVSAILDAYAEARSTKDRPTMIVAGTVKGKGVSSIEGKDGWHGKAFKKGPEMDAAIAELERQVVAVPSSVDLARSIPKPASRPSPPAAPRAMAAPSYSAGEQVATREAYGAAIAKLGEADARVVALDADVKNSTFSDKFEKVFPDRFYQNFIAEQVMIGSAMGLAARGAIPFPSTFAAFLTRAADFIRMAAISGVNIKMAGSHAGVSIGEDGPSQMALEDLAMFRAQPNIAVLYPCDAVSGAAGRGGSELQRPGLHQNEPAEDPGDLRSRRGVFSRRAEGAAGERQRRGHGCGRRRDGVRGAEGLRAAEGRRHVHPRHRPLLGRARGRRGSHQGGDGDGRADHHRRGSLSGRRHRRRSVGGRWRGGHSRAAHCGSRDPEERQARGAARPLRDLGEPHRQCRGWRGVPPRVSLSACNSLSLAFCSEVRI